MTYSSGLFATVKETLKMAQLRKYLRVAETLDLRPGDRILEVGCGWGGFAEMAAAEYGCEVVGITLSREQASYANERMLRSGLADKVEIRLQDYRDVRGRFNKVVSIEMLEAVGAKYWTMFFDVLSQRLVKGGRAALQSITINSDKFDTYRKDPDFIQRHIFPGGMLPSKDILLASATSAGFRVCETLFFGASYAETLRRWDRSFQNKWSDLSALGFDERFYKMWHYYLSYCEVGFDQGAINVGQFFVDRP